jgi:hypothetical protein
MNLFNNKNKSNKSTSTGKTTTSNQLIPTFVYGKVTQIIDNDNYSNGNIRWVPYSPGKNSGITSTLERQKNNMSVGQKAAPFFNFFQYFPTIGEIILVINNPNNEDRDIPYFYFPSLGISKNTYNPQAKLYDINSEGDIDLGSGLKESNIAKNKPTNVSQGSTKIENRSGASLHFGSVDMGKSPFVKLVNGQGGIDPNLTLATEDINKNCCSIYMTEKQQVPIRCSSLNFKSFDISDDDIAQYNKDLDEMAAELEKEAEKPQYNNIPESSKETSLTPITQDKTTDEALVEELYTQTNETPITPVEKETPVVGGEGQSTFEVLRKGSLIITIPKDSEGNIFTQEASVIWGGIGEANPDFMLKNIQESTKKRKILIIAPYTKKLSSIKSYISTNVSELEGIFLQYNSLCGFSEGGKQVWSEVYDVSLNFIGLIDPSTNEDDIQTYNTLSADIKKKIRCMARPNNWGGDYIYIGVELQKLLDVAKEEGNSDIVEKIAAKSYNHEQIPPKFFLKYKDLI